MCATSQAPTPPVQVRPELLPLGQISWERFEVFCRALVLQLPGVIDCHQYGKTGSKQRGIDLTATRSDGQVWAFQCRRYQRYSAEQARKAVTETTFNAHRYFLLVSCELGTDVRDHFLTLPEWEAWDVRDMSQRVRMMPMAEAARLVETHFGKPWRDAFLGLSDEYPLAAASEYFGPLLTANRLFNHSWDLVGRDIELRRLEVFTSLAVQRVALLTGRGGIGKSKLLQALASSGDGPQIRFLKEGVGLTTDSVRHLPPGQHVIVVDDAHRREDLAHLVAASAPRPDLKIVLSLRPQGLDGVWSTLTGAYVDPRDVVQFPELKELGPDDVRKLAEQALGVELAHLASRLAAVTWDSPLVTVVGGRLLAEKALDPNLLERDTDFRHEVLTRFQEVLIGRVSQMIDPSVCRSLLRLCSAVAPIRLDDPKRLECMAEFLDRRLSDLLRDLGILEESGVLLRKGDTLRITPDVLSDNVLHNTCLTRGGRPTGYAEEVFNAFSAVAPKEMLGNLAELDWRVRASGQEESDLLDPIWGQIEGAFEQGGLPGRVRLLELISDVSYYQPARTLALVERAMHEPLEPDGDIGLYTFTQADVEEKLPGLLRMIAFNAEFLPRCLDLLWQLGRNDGRPTNSYPDHAMRVLEDLAEYQPRKPAWFNGMVLDGVERWLADPDVNGYLHSPLGVLEPLLAKSGYTSESQGYQVALNPFLVDPGNTRALRNRALDVLRRCATGTSPRLRIRAIRCLGEALREPMPLFGSVVREEDAAAWVPEQMTIFGILEDLVGANEDPILHIAVWRAVDWYAQHSRRAEIQTAATRIIERIPKDFNTALARLLLSNWDHLIDVGEDPDYQAHERIVARMRADTATQFREMHPTATEVVAALEDWLLRIKETGQQPEPDLFLPELAALDGESALAVCQVLVLQPSSDMAPYFHIFLRAARTHDSHAALNAGMQALATGAIVFKRSLALSYQRGDWLGVPGERSIMSQLLADEDWGTRHLALLSLQLSARANPHEALELAMSADIGDDTNLGDDLCQLLGPGWGIDIDDLTDDRLDVVLRKLVLANDVGEFHTVRFLQQVAARDPERFIDFFFARMDRKVAADADYRPVPFREVEFADLHSHAKYPTVIRKIRDRTTVAGAWEREFWLPKLFRDVSAGYNDESVAALDEWSTSGDRQKLEAVGTLLREAGVRFLFERIDFIAQLLDAAATHGEDCLKEVRGDLWAVATLGSSTRTPGQPGPREVYIRDESNRVASNLPPGSQAALFSRWLAKDAERRIRDDLARDEERE